MFWVGFLSDDRLTWRGPDRGEFQSGEMSRQKKGQGMGGSKHGTGPSRETSKQGDVQARKRSKLGQGRDQDRGGVQAGSSPSWEEVQTGDRSKGG